MKKKNLVLPDAEAEFTFSEEILNVEPHEFIDNELVLVGGGCAPEIAWLQKVAKNRPIWCIDHGIDCCCQANLLPQKLIGDFDSATPQSLQWAKAHDVSIEKFPPEKDYTDTQLALNFAQTANAFIILTAALGGRFDHAYSTIFSFAHSNLQGCIADEKETIFFLRDNESLTLTLTKKPKAISLLPLTEKVTDVNILGVQWELKKALLTQGLPYAISNVAINNSVQISINKGIIAVYICWQETGDSADNE